jgi:chlorite dismutase
MSSEHHHGPASPRARKAEPPPAPLTLDGSPVLHQMFRLRWPAWRALAADRRAAIAQQTATTLAEMESHAEGGSALFAQLGHKGDLMLVHFRRSFEALHEAELRLVNLELYEHLEPAASYVSTVELGLYATALQAYPQWMAQGLEPGSEAWVAAEREKIAEQAAAMAPRLYPSIPPTRYLCFYPMDKKRGEQKNWYAEPIADRGRMMRDHGMIGRRYAGKVKQIISGSIGFDDWEWGVDLFADDPLVFKQLIYEMRFDEASAWYALFGPFHIGIRVAAVQLPNWLEGRPPRYGAPPSEP